MLSVRHTSYLLLPARTTKLLKVPQIVHNPTLSESKPSVTVPPCEKDVWIMLPNASSCSLYFNNRPVINLSHLRA